MIVNDSFGRLDRLGSMGMAIGFAGISAVERRKQTDLFGGHITPVIALVDELSAAASMLMGQGNEGMPVVIVRGTRIPPTKTLEFATSFTSPNKQLRLATWLRPATYIARRRLSCRRSRLTAAPCLARPVCRFARARSSRSTANPGPHRCRLRGSVADLQPAHYSKWQLGLSPPSPGRGRWNAGGHLPGAIA